MRYVSTRGRAPSLGFSDAVLTGLAPDGGLYLPETWPQIGQEEIAGFAGAPYARIAEAVVGRFVDAAVADAGLSPIIEAAYARFDHRSVTPLIEIEPGHFLLELFHGPTLSFKDLAMQFLGPLMERLLADRKAHSTIVVATSGDTGSAAIEAFAGREGIDIVVLHPEGRISQVQRRQMTTVTDANVHNLAIRGTFDNCQSLVKAMFANRPFRERMALSAVNSINWGRIAAQTIYYFKAAASLGAPESAVRFTVPTGNFGDIFAGYAAMRMGLPVDELVIATNANDILTRTLQTGRYETGDVVATMSPSMDIQVSSNFERLLFEAARRDADAVASMMNSLAQSGGFGLPDRVLASIRGTFAAGTVSEDETLETIADLKAGSGYLADPHTAVGVAVARKRLTPANVMVTLAPAHPAKFPEAVGAAIGVAPPLPAELGDLHERPERVTVLDNDQGAVERYIADSCAAGRTSP